MKKNKNLKITIFIAIIAVFIGASGMYLVMYNFPLTESGKTVFKDNKNVQIVDEGLAESVEKLNDAVVVVEAYSDLKQISSGSGFVYKVQKDEAYILTNNHVIAESKDIRVTFLNGENHKVEILGNELYSDIAVLKIDAKHVTMVAEIGKSEEIRLGDTVFAVGAPLASKYSGTVTRGIVSGKNRMVEVNFSNTSTSDYIMKVIQTDAAINSGNSGGPLANANGEVIGITNMKLVSSGVEGIGFAIPIEDALAVVKKIESGKSVDRPLLGISMLELNDLYGLYHSNITIDPSIKNGVAIVEVQKDSSADKAGIIKGDVITKINDIKVFSIAELRYQLYRYESGEEITITLMRNKKESTVKVILKT